VSVWPFSSIFLLSHSPHPCVSVGCVHISLGFRQSHGIPKGCWSPSEHVCLLVFESVLDRSYWLTNINAVESYFDFSSSHWWSHPPLLRTPSYWIHLPARYHLAKGQPNNKHDWSTRIPGLSVELTSFPEHHVIVVYTGNLTLGMFLSVH